MRTGADSGVSLIELLVVVAVLSVLAVGLSLPLRDDGNRVASDAVRFQSFFDRTRTLAIHSQTKRGLRLTPRDMALMHSTSNGWQVSNQSIRFQVRADFRDQTPPGSEVAYGAPEITFLPNGQTTAFQLRFFGSGSGTAVCESDGWKGMTCDQK